MRIATLKSSIVMSFFLLIGAYTAAGKVIYVDTDAQGPVNDGSSWTTAFEYLQEALTGASSGDQIRVAQGIYKPHEPVLLPPTVPPLPLPPDRTATFQLKNGVLIRGGYAGFGEPNPDARDIELYETILSGDLDGNDIDVNDAWDVWREPTFAENSYHVVTGSGTNSTAVLDGFAVTGGCANDAVPDGSNNGDILFTSGAGMLNDSGSPTVMNCTFRKNTTWTSYGYSISESGIDDGNLSLESTYIFLPGTSGAAVFNRDSSPTLQNCLFEENVTFGADASSAGAGVCNINSSPVLTNCVFRTNEVTGFDSECYGGAMANYSSNPTLKGCSFVGNLAVFSFGGAIYNEESDPILENCTFRNNESGGSGGAIFVNGGNSTLTNCVFDKNMAYSFGGAMCIGDGLATLTDCMFIDNVASGGGALYSDFHNRLTLKGCTFIDNSAGGYGGAIENSGAWYNDPNSVTLIEDCVFTANSAYLGGGIHNGWNRKNLTVVNCLFAGNAAANAGGGIYNYGCEQILSNCTFAGNSALEGDALASDLLYWQESPSNLQITNCIFRNGENGIRNDANSVVTITYSDVEGGWPGEGNIDADPLFVESGYWDANGTPADANDDFWVDGDYHLLDGSLCIDAGDNSAVPTTVTTDLDGKPRIKNGIVDMGAYESRAVFFVDIDATGANDGSSWADAYNYLQDALMMVPVGDEIRVAEGTYKPDQFVLSDRPNLGRIETFQLTNGVAIKGGYAGFGEPNPDARDIDVYKTVLSGDLNGDDVEVNDPCDLLTEASRADNCYHVVTAIEDGYYDPDTNTILDGFTITGGNADGQEPEWELGAGGGMYNRYSSPTVINCTFTDNSARSGGGMNNEAGWPYLINCTFSRNFSSWGGGLANGDRPTLIDCTFIGNVSSNKGGAMACYDGSPPMNNCSFIDNRAVLGGAIYGGDCSPKPTDCTFTGNSAEKGGVVYNNDSSILLTNCTLSGNWATTGGVIYDDEGGSILINCTLTANTAITGGVMYGTDDSYVRLTNCILSGNSAVTGGVLYSGDESYVRLTNCILSGNTAESDGVIYIYDEGNMELIHCTLAVNSADNGNVLVCDSYEQQYPSSIEMTNCIFWNSGSEIWNNDGSTITITYSDVQGGWPGEGNIDAEPLFVESGYWDTNEVWVEGDYHLQIASGCIDAGTDADVYEDVDGNVRPIDITGVDNNGELPDFDMGAYEAVAMIQGKLIMQPNKVNRNARGKKIFAVLRLPEPIVEEDIDLSEPLVLYPGGIEADEQKLLPDKTADDSVRIRAVFDRAELLAVTPDNGDVEVIVAGRFISGLCFYGTGTVTIK